MTDEEWERYRWPETEQELRRRTMISLYSVVDTTTLEPKLRDELANAMQGVYPNLDGNKEILYVVSQVLRSTVIDLDELKHKVKKLERRLQELEQELAARGKSPDSSDYRSFRNLTWRWFIDASEKPKTSNRAGSTPRSASRADSSRSNGPFSPQKAQNDVPGLGPADSGASRPPSGDASAVPG